MTTTSRHALLSLLLALGCDSSTSSDGNPNVGSSTSSLSCFHTESQVACAETDELSEESRTRVEDFYPSACLDGDQDGDGTPDFLDLDFSDGDSSGGGDDDADGGDDDLRCPHCNRGPGTQNDFRLRIEGTDGELERGKVYAAADGSLTVPTPDGVLTVSITDSTEVEDGMPSPGAEIRAEGTMEGSTLIATRLKVLCPGPAALPPEEVPPEATPPEPDPSEPVPPIIVE